jgi:tRNA threonylcarbamoyl adenosine modification protein YeaZ
MGDRRLMLILSFDTTNEHGGVGVYRDRVCLAEIANRGGTNYSIGLFDMVDRLLAEARLQLGDIDLLATANGPGSFTGIRVGLAAAQGWAKALGRPARGVSVLEAMVEAATADSDIALPLLDARRGEFYFCPFRRAAAGGQKSGGDSLQAGNPPRYSAAAEGMAMKPNQIELWARQLAGNGRSGDAPPSICCVTREQDGAAQSLRSALSGMFDWKVAPGILTGAIASLALRARHEGNSESASGLDAYYVRRSDAELHWRE